MRPFFAAIPIVLLLVWFLSSQLSTPSLQTPADLSSKSPGPTLAPVADLPESIEEVTDLSDENSTDPLDTRIVEWSIAGRIYGPDGLPVTAGSANLDPDPEHNRGPINHDRDEDPATFVIEVEQGYVGSLLVTGASDKSNPDQQWVGQRIEVVRAEPGSEPTLAVHLQRGRTVSGIVIDLQRNPVVNALVTTGPRASSQQVPVFFGSSGIDNGADLMWPSTTTDSSGRFILGGIPPRTCSISASAGDKHEGIRHSNILQLPPGTEEITLTIGEKTELPVLVIDSNRQPVLSYEGSICLYTIPSDGVIGTPTACTSTGSDPAHSEQVLSPSEVGSLMIVAIDDHRYEPYSRKIEVTPGLNERVEIILQPAASIVGRVVDTELRPIEGAVISILNQQDHFFDTFDIDDRRQDTILKNSIEEVRRTRSLSDGTFLLSPVATSKSVSIQIEHKEYLTHKIDTNTYPPRENDLGDQILSAGIQLRGVVLSPDGSPASKALVRLNQMAETAETMEGFNISISFQNHKLVMADQAQHDQFSTITDIDGEFVLNLPEGGDYTMHAESTGFRNSESLELSIHSSIEGIILQLLPQQRIEGIVVDIQGVAIAGVRLALSKKHEESSTFLGLTTSGYDDTHCTSEHDGFFSALVPEQGNYLLQVAAGQRWVGTETLAVESEDRDVVVTALAAGRVEGQVIDAITGVPIPSFSIQQSKSLDALQNNPDGGVSYNDPDGMFELEGLKGITYYLRVQAQGYVSVNEEVGVNLGETSVVTSALQHSAIITGRLIDSVGDPIEGAGIRWTRPGVEPPTTNSVNLVMTPDGGFTLVVNDHHSIRTDSDGYFTITDIEGGDWTLHANRSNQSNLTIDVRNTAPGVVTDTGTHTLESLPQ